MSERIIDLRNLGDDFVIHYGGRLNQVNAYTFANSLLGLANSIRATNTVLRAILERSPRLWEFVRHGNRIAAPVVDQEFYDALYTRSISLATGDILDVTLAIKQRPIGDTGIFENVGYEVRKVHGHDPRPVQERIKG